MEVINNPQFSSINPLASDQSLPHHALFIEKAQAAGQLKVEGAMVWPWDGMFSVPAYCWFTIAEARNWEFRVAKADLGKVFSNEWAYGDILSFQYSHDNFYYVTNSTRNCTVLASHSIPTPRKPKPAHPHPPDWEGN